MQIHPKICSVDKVVKRLLEAVCTSGARVPDILKTLLYHWNGALFRGVV